MRNSTPQIDETLYYHLQEMYPIMHGRLSICESGGEEIIERLSEKKLLVRSMRAINDGVTSTVSRLEDLLQRTRRA